MFPSPVRNMQASWWLSSKESTCRRRRRCGFNPSVGKIPWRRVWKSTPIFLPAKSHDTEVWWATVHRVTKSWTQLKWLSTHAHIVISIGHPSFCFSKQLTKSWGIFVVLFFYFIYSFFMKSFDHMFNIKNKFSSFVSHFYKWCKYLLLYIQ